MDAIWQDRVRAAFAALVARLSGSLGSPGDVQALVAAWWHALGWAGWDTFALFTGSQLLIMAAGGPALLVFGWLLAALLRRRWKLARARALQLALLVMLTAAGTGGPMRAFDRLDAMTPK
jgi:hypothetical protein